MRFVRPSVSVVLIAAVLALGGAGAGAQDEPTPELISDDGAADAPPRTDAAAYTQYFVRQAIERYDAEGLEATLEHYNDPASVDGQWYMFIVDAEGTLIGHATRPDLLGTSTAERRDFFGKPYGREVMAADAEGRWVDYYFTHPETGEPEQKHSWVVRHDGVYFGSGWYDVDESEAPPKAVGRAYARYLVSEATDRYDDQGLDYAVEYHNSPDALDGPWYVFIIDSDGTSLANANRPDLVGTDTSGLVDTTGKAYGAEVVAAPAEGAWVDYLFTHPDTGEDAPKHSWVVRHDGLIFGAGWHRPDEAPARNDVAAYTQYLVGEAVDRYERTGRDATVEHLNRADAVDGQWYVFVDDTDGTILVHPARPDLLGEDVSGRVDVNGKAYGAEIVAAGPGGRWVDYFTVDPSDGETRQKYSWIINYDGLVFGSGWYTVPESADTGEMSETGDSGEMSDADGEMSETEDSGGMSDPDGPGEDIATG